MDILGEFLKNGNFKLVGQESKFIICTLREGFKKKINSIFQKLDLDMRNNGR